MRIKKQKPVFKFMRLRNVARRMGASQRSLVSDLLTLTDRERRELADALIKKEV